jgi:hypothetical protein
MADGGRTTRGNHTMALDDYDDVSAKTIPALIQSVECEKNYDAALRLIEIYWSYADSKREIPSGLQEYVARCFGRMIDGESPADALNLKRARGRPRNPDAHVTLLMAAIHIHESHQAGIKHEEAVARAAEKYFVDGKEAERAFYDNRALIEGDPFGR